MFFAPRPTPPTVSQRGAPAGCVLRGFGPNNQGLRLRVDQEQARGSSGPIRGPFEILDPGDNTHADALRALLGRATDAQEVLRAIRQRRPACVSVANANLLTVEEAAGFRPAAQGPTGTSRSSSR